jgi:CRISPR-associated protein Cas5h
VKIAHFGLNWLETKGQVLSVGLVEARTQINAEFLKQPRFRIYVMLRDQSRQRELSQMVRDHRSVYTPCLGISELLADFAWLGDWSARPAGQSVVNVTSVLPVASVVWPMEGQGVEFENRKRYDKKRVPRLMDENRVVLEWQDVLAETSGQTIRAQVADGWQIGDDYVVWL